jgi:hypothetical protein
MTARRTARPTETQIRFVANTPEIFYFRSSDNAPTILFDSNDTEIRRLVQGEWRTFVGACKSGLIKEVARDNGHVYYAAC